MTFGRGGRATAAFSHGKGCGLSRSMLPGRYYGGLTMDQHDKELGCQMLFLAGLCVGSVSAIVLVFAVAARWLFTGQWPF